VRKNGQVIAEVEGEDSPEVKVFAHDTFPPAQPTGVQAVFSGVGQKPFIDVTWAPNTDEDLAGYNVYRHEQGTEPQKLNAKLLATPSFRDDAVQPGHTYIYAISAVDLRNNESQRSEESSETVPK
jgi:fibronectin type 3 domain-containing protein